MLAIPQFYSLLAIIYQTVALGRIFLINGSEGNLERLSRNTVGAGPLTRKTVWAAASGIIRLIFSLCTTMFSLCFKNFTFE